MFAGAVHAASERPGPMVSVNCAALPGELAESELFGYERGARSQARERKAGIIHQADGGTLFLDEIGDTPFSTQAKLLRFLESSEVLPLGASRATRMNVRVLAATSSLEANGEIPGLRNDLAARLAAEAVVLPPLRARAEDVGALASYFLRQAGAPSLTAAGFLALCLHDWPNNVRELRRVLNEAAVLAAGTEAIGLDHLPSTLSARLGSSGKVKRRSPRSVPTREELTALLERHRGNIAEVARALDRQWAVVHRSVERYGLDPEQSRER